MLSNTHTTPKEILELSSKIFHRDFDGQIIKLFVRYHIFCMRFATKARSLYTCNAQNWKVSGEDEGDIYKSLSQLIIYGTLVWRWYIPQLQSKIFSHEQCNIKNEFNFVVNESLLIVLIVNFPNLTFTILFSILDSFGISIICFFASTFYEALFTWVLDTDPLMSGFFKPLTQFSFFPHVFRQLTTCASKERWKWRRVPVKYSS